MTRNNKGLASLLALILLLVIVGAIGLFKSYENKPITDTVNYQIHIYEDGSATISLDNISHVMQLEHDVNFGAGYYLMPGTLIIPGDGDQVIFESPRRDYVERSE